MHTLRQLREAKGLLQKDIASYLGVDRTTYVKYERGDSEPSFQTLTKLADFFGVSVDYILNRNSTMPHPSTGVWVPVLGHVAAGIPIEAVEDILDYEEISDAMAQQGEHFALKIKGDSMSPRMVNGDVVIVRKQSDVNSGDIAVVLVNGDEATVKRIKKRPEGLMLIPSNTNFEPMFYTNEDIAKLPVVILGRVVELRVKF